MQILKVDNMVISLKAVASTRPVWTDVRFPDRLYRSIGKRDVLRRWLLQLKEKFWDTFSRLKTDNKGGAINILFQWHNLHLSCKTRLKLFHILWESLPTQRSQKNLLSTGKIMWESRNKGNRLEISVASLEEVDPRASKSMGNFVKYIWIMPLK